MIYPCSVSQETLRFDIYSPQLQENGFEFTGTVSNRLTVISDLKQIREFSKSVLSSSIRPSTSLSRRGVASERTVEISADLNESSRFEDHARPNMSLNSGSYAVNASDSFADIATKFLHLLALGPITRSEFRTVLDPNGMVSESELNSLVVSHTQLYSAANTFTDSDIFPSIALESVDPDESVPFLILKDKAYKDLRPWVWTAYTPFERGLILENAGNALTRLGFLETHPLRRKIVDKTSHDLPVKKPTALGGGLILNSGKKVSTPSSPQRTGFAARKVAAESPSLDFDRRRQDARCGTSPLKENQTKRRYDTSLMLCLSSSDEERHRKKAKRNVNRSYSSASTNSTSSASSNSSINLARSHHSSTSYTLPFSVNEEGPDENTYSVPIKYPAIAKPTISLPLRPLNAMSTQEKKLQFYLQLARKFRLRYHEYEMLYKQMFRAQGRGADNKKSLMKLFELHNSLAEWKRKLWDYHKENNMAESVMNLSKHRKLMSTSALSVLTPLSSRFQSLDRFPPKDNSVDRAVVNSRGSPPASAVHPKVALNY